MTLSNWAAGEGKDTAVRDNVAAGEARIWWNYFRLIIYHCAKGRIEVGAIGEVDDSVDSRRAGRVVPAVKGMYTARSGKHFGE